MLWPMSDAKRIDMHVHIVGNGSSGSGCWFRLKGMQKLLAKYMLHHVGLPANTLSGDMDRVFVDRLLELVRSSSIDAAVLLAQDRVHDENGRLLEDKGTIYVPNGFVLDLARKHSEFLAAVSIHPARPDAIEEL